MKRFGVVACLFWVGFGLAQEPFTAYWQKVYVPAGSKVLGISETGRCITFQPPGGKSTTACGVDDEKSIQESLDPKRATDKQIDGATQFFYRCPKIAYENLLSIEAETKKCKDALSDKISKKGCVTTPFVVVSTKRDNDPAAVKAIVAAAKAGKPFPKGFETPNVMGDAISFGSDNCYIYSKNLSNFACPDHSKQQDLDSSYYLCVREISSGRSARGAGEGSATGAESR
ncbi:hypothetical protein K2X30_06165 [bacterium]|jgi:hypothetical protein|nr:hypothetical protein [bacterium]